MSVPLTAWFRNWVAGRDSGYPLPSSKLRRPSYLNPAKTCVACQKRLISQGKSQLAVYARRARKCITCYNVG